MLNVEQIKAMIAHRIVILCNSCNSYHRNCVVQQIRALLSVLTDGRVPPNIGSMKALYTACELAGIPFVQHGESVKFDDDWLRAHGFTVEENGCVHHPTLGWGW